MENPLSDLLTQRRNSSLLILHHWLSVFSSWYFTCHQDDKRDNSIDAGILEVLDFDIDGGAVGGIGAEGVEEGCVRETLAGAGVSTVIKRAGSVYEGDEVHGCSTVKSLYCFPHLPPLDQASIPS